jgi:hypothetical protein
MNRNLAETLASQRGSELRAEGARQAAVQTATRRGERPTRIRRRAGLALVSIGLRLAYQADASQR